MIQCCFYGAPSLTIQMICYLEITEQIFIKDLPTPHYKGRSHMKKIRWGLRLLVFCQLYVKQTSISGAISFLFTEVIQIFF